MRISKTPFTAIAVFWISFSIFLRPFDASAADGLDPNFGANGIVATDITNADNHIRALVVQPDGKLIATGSAWIGGSNQTAVMRYNENGSLDPSFNGDGIVTFDFGFVQSQPSALALQTDGKVVVVGSVYKGEIGPYGNADYDFALARFNPDGSLDNSFDCDGKVTVSMAPEADLAYALAIDASGRILVGGGSMENGSYSFALSRLNQNGSLDASFSGDGKLIMTTKGFINAVGIQPDGMIVIAGTEGLPKSQIVVARLSPGGSLDWNFNFINMQLGGGKVTTTIAAGADSASAVDALGIQADGKIVIAGYTTTSISGSDKDIALVRYNPNGSLDSSFDGDGKVVTSMGTNDTAHALVILPTGKIMVAAASDARFALARYNPGGSLDSGFGNGGTVVTTIGTGDAEAFGLAIQSEGKKVVAAGSSHNGTNYDATLARYFADLCGNGVVDGGEQCDDGNATDGDGCDNNCTQTGYGNGIVTQGEQCDDGNTNNGDGCSSTCQKEPPSAGDLDPSFGGDGIVTLDLASNVGWSRLVQTPIGIFVGGATYISPGTYGGVTALYRPGGALNSGFQGDGVAIGGDFDGLGMLDDGALQTLQAGSKLVTLDHTQTGTKQNPPISYTSTLARHDINTLNNSLSVDSNFGSNGKVVLQQLLPQADIRSVEDLSANPDGTILVTGRCGSSDGYLLRLDTNGAADTTFNASGNIPGFVLLDEAKDTNTILVQATGKIIVVGEAGPPTKAYLARYNPDGTLDATFTNGVRNDLIFPQYWNIGFLVDDATLQSDGNEQKIVVAGTYYCGTMINGQKVEKDCAAMARFLANGNLDTAFATGGLWLSQVMNHGRAIASQSDGKLILASEDSTGKSPKCGIAPTTCGILSRFLPNASPDTTFGTGGDVVIPKNSGKGVESPSAIALDPYGRIWIAGDAKEPGPVYDTNPTLARHLGDQPSPCGNGTVDPGEACDDGNTLSGDGCDVNCTPTGCGNSVLTSGSGEVCDDGNTSNGDGCSSSCQAECPASCDDSNPSTNDVCNQTTNFLCKHEPISNCPGPSECGDGTLDPGEDCDDGNTADGDGCNSTCQDESVPAPPADCGNGQIESGEECDDGNAMSGDSCSSTCQNEPQIPDPIPECPPSCDDENACTTDSCGQNTNYQCQHDPIPNCPPAAVCGNGTVEAGEQCDPPSSKISFLQWCTSDCQEKTILLKFPVCGNGKLESSEACDDGNKLNGDGCNSKCQIEFPKFNRELQKYMPSLKPTTRQTAPVR